MPARAAASSATYRVRMSSVPSITRSASARSSSASPASKRATTGTKVVSGERADAASAADSTFGRPTSAGACSDLPVQVGDLDAIVVDERDAADARGDEGRHHGAAESARAEHDHVRVGEAALRVDAPSGEHALAGVPGIGGIEGHASILAGGMASGTVRARASGLPLMRHAHSIRAADTARLDPCHRR